MNNCLSGTMSLGANLLSIFVPSYFLTVTNRKISEENLRNSRPDRSKICVIREISVAYTPIPLFLSFFLKENPRNFRKFQ